jgi:ABC-type multidrug transport system permease subunit
VNNLRLFWQGGLFTYRALFNWISPVLYTTTMLGSPLFQIVFFTYLGRAFTDRPDSFFIIGNAVQVSAMSGIYAGTMTIANERQFGTLSPLLATPANRFLLFFGRSVPVIWNGVLVSVFGFGVGMVLLHLELAATDLPALALVLVVTVASCTTFGMMLGSFGLRARDVFFASNLVYFLMLLFCGVNVPIDELPRWMQAVGNGMPLTHGIEAARDVADGRSLGDVGGLVLWEAAIGAFWSVAAFLLFRVFEAEGRRRASLETF